MRKFENPVGKTFGELTVLRRTKDKIWGSRSQKRWIAKCSCGIELETNMQNLHKKGSPVCRRCAAGYIDLAGKSFGQLTVIKEDVEYRSSSGKKLIYWVCQCSCGDIYSVRGGHLKEGRTTRCNKCGHRSRQLNGYISSTLYHNIKYGARTRNIHFSQEITREYLWELYIQQNKKCSLSDIDIIFADTTKDHISNRGTTASLDRIDSREGYVKSNIQWVHKDINIMKRHHDQKYFLELCKKVVEHNKG